VAKAHSATISAMSMIAETTSYFREVMDGDGAFVYAGWCGDRALSSAASCASPGRSGADLGFCGEHS